jgi:hypothetical protein
MTGPHEDQMDWREEARKEGQALHDAMPDVPGGTPALQISDDEFECPEGAK